MTYVPAGRLLHPGPTGPGAVVAPGAVVPPVGAVVAAGVTALGGIFKVSPGYGNCDGDTMALYANKAVTEMPYLLATLMGVSPDCTTYVCSAPAAPGGNVVVVPGAVLATGGMVAKLVGVTFTTVVATPKVSPPHADNEVANTAAHTDAAAMRPNDGRANEVNTSINSRGSRAPNGGASRR